MGLFCCTCGEENDRPEYGNCRSCHAAYMRAHRPKHSELSDEQRRRANARAYANVYQRRGKLVPEPCKECGGTENVEKHHPDYSQPLLVEWLCRICHHLLHGTEKQQAAAALKDFARRKLAEANKKPHTSEVGG